MTDIFENLHRNFKNGVLAGQMAFAKAEGDYDMKDTIIHTIQSHYGVQPEEIEALGGGFYGRAFLVTIPCHPHALVAKLYLFSGYGEKEAEQLRLLSGHCRLKVPEVYEMRKAAGSGIKYDIMLMEYLPGVNAGDFDASRLPEENRNTICNEIVDNLIAIHSAVNREGFGPVNGPVYCGTWQEYYYPIACGIVDKAHALYEKGQLSEYILEIFDRSIAAFDKIFDQPVTEARLIHGDYNTWNILLTEERNHADAVIDPFGCCWADSEYDLYQLDNANGKAYGLLERYLQLRPVSRNFNRKRCFYELYSEVSHYHDALVEADQKAVGILAEKLEKEMEIHCIFGGGMVTSGY